MFVPKIGTCNVDEIDTLRIIPQMVLPVVAVIHAPTDCQTIIGQSRFLRHEVAMTGSMDEVARLTMPTTKPVTF
jgi:hypothetical protein